MKHSQPNDTAIACLQRVLFYIMNVPCFLYTHGDRGPSALVTTTPFF
ncbi:ORFL10W_IRL [Human betaherpesvirus 5]|nr:ORFL10C [Human betaherpesvirus 5]QHX40299.1 ORFL10C_TRL [Human betaherpesvirus 5]QHX40673.1 ORFL10W_IRL [Human betaherpesvirus 5]